MNSFDTFKGKFIIIKLDEKPFHDQLLVLNNNLFLSFLHVIILKPP